MALLPILISVAIILLSLRQAYSEHLFFTKSKKQALRETAANLENIILQSPRFTLQEIKSWALILLPPYRKRVQQRVAQKILDAILEGKTPNKFLERQETLKALYPHHLHKEEDQRRKDKISR